MSASRKPGKMTADDFLAWTATLEGDVRYELVGGEPLAMAPELLSHGEVKGIAFARLFNAVAAAGLPCRVLVDSVGVRVGEDSMFIPDILVHCGPRPPEGREVNDPVIIVEVESPSTAWLDGGPKLAGYFGLPSLRHYLLISPRSRLIVHHERRSDGVIETHFCGEGPVRLDPPGLVLADVFPAVE